MTADLRRYLPDRESPGICNLSGIEAISFCRRYQVSGAGCRGVKIRDTQVGSKERQHGIDFRQSRSTAILLEDSTKSIPPRRVIEIIQLENKELLAHYGELMRAAN